MRILKISLFLLLSICSHAQGVYFSKVIPATEYGANSQNFDLVCDDYGTVFVANMEGLIYYDGSSWRKLYTPGISRITRLAKSADGRIWFGGYDVIGYLFSDSHGRLQVKALVSDKKVKTHFEVNKITQADGKIIFHTTKNKTFTFACRERVTFPHENDGGRWSIEPDGIKVEGAPSAFTQLTKEEGLMGEVICAGEIGNTLYIGTREGLFRVSNGKVTRIPGIDLNCNALVNIAGGQLLAVTGNGLFIISSSGTRQITRDNTLSACIDPNNGDIISGEIDGVYRVTRNGSKKKIYSKEKVISLSFSNGKLQEKTIYESKAEKVNYRDRFGGLWTTDANGYNLQLRTTEKLQNTMKLWLHPITLKSVSMVYVKKNGDVLVGSESGIIIINMNFVKKTPLYKNDAPYIREIVMGDSVIWGGYRQDGMRPVTRFDDVTIPYNFSSFTVRFSVPMYSCISTVLYRFQLNDGGWSPWTDDAFVNYKNLDYGSNKLIIQAKDLMGRQSPLASVKIYVVPPFYMSIYAWIFYLLVLIGLISLLFRYRTKRLEKEKMKLEGIVAERTAELTDTLDDLKRTQEDLVRMERTATAGKLTQGLIDRILNPINYINNFSKLTSGLAKDLHDDIEDEKENMSEENYEDCEDILDMMTQNLTKIEEHGVNTTRTLRAMEAMLNNHIGTLVPLDIIPLCSHAISVTTEYHKDIIANCGITVIPELPAEPVMVKVDAEAFNKILLSILGNSIHAVAKKYEEKQYEAEVRLKVEASDSIIVTIHDNGIGIEDAIKDKIFDPFFTTKPTGVAAGVGLYLVRELVHDHKAEITMNSEQGSYCEFTIAFPKVVES